MGKEEAAPNGASEHPLRGWVIARDGGDSYVGRVVGEEDGLVQLEPAYSCLEGWEVGPRGEVARKRLIVPLEFMTSARTVRIRPGTVFDLGHLDLVDARVFKRAIDGAEDIRKHLSAARSGILVSPKMPAPSKA
jgi:hypothetical protein